MDTWRRCGYKNVVESTIRKRTPKSAPGQLRRRVSDPAAGPLSVPLPAELRARLAAQAERRNLKMATAARIFLDERVRELEETELLSQAEEWQRAQAWGTWEKIKAGDEQDVPLERFREHAARALERLSAKKASGR